MAGFTVSGPDVDRPAESASSGLSIAVTYASRASRARQEASYYVRDAAGDVVGRADADGSGSVSVIGEGALAAYRVRQISETPDRASASVSPPEDTPGRASSAPRSAASGAGDSRGASLADGRPGPRQPTKEDSMAGQKTQGRASSRAKKAAATTSSRPAEKGEKGTDLLAALMQVVGQQVDGDVEAKTNPSKTSTRLLIKGSSKAFAVIFPPRSNGLAVKIPKHLLSIEAELPKGHGFHRVGWGLSRTITKASEVPSVAKVFAVAAAHVAPPAASAATEPEPVEA